MRRETSDRPPTVHVGATGPILGIANGGRKNTGVSIESRTIVVHRSSLLSNIASWVADKLKSWF